MTFGHCEIAKCEVLLDYESPDEEPSLNVVDELYLPSFLGLLLLEFM